MGKVTIAVINTTNPNSLEEKSIMKTSIFTMSIAFVSALTLVGCGSDSSSGSSNNFSATDVSCTVKQNSNNVVKTQIGLGIKDVITYTFVGDSVQASDVMTFVSEYNADAISQVCENQKQNSSATVTCTSSQITIVTKEKSTYSNDLTLLEMGKTNECKEFTDTMNSAN